THLCDRHWWQHSAARSWSDRRRRTGRLPRLYGGLSSTWSIPTQAGPHRRILLRAVLGGNAVGPLHGSGHTLRTPLRAGSPAGWPGFVAAGKPASITGFWYGQPAGRPWPPGRR